MKTLCAFILLRMVRAFQHWPCYIAPAEVKDINETKLLTTSETADGYAVLISYKDEPYLINIRPVRSQVEVKPKSAAEMFPQDVFSRESINRIAGFK